MSEYNYKSQDEEDNMSEEEWQGQIPLRILKLRSC